MISQLVIVSINFFARGVFSELKPAKAHRLALTDNERRHNPYLIQIETLSLITKQQIGAGLRKRAEGFEFPIVRQDDTTNRPF